MGSPPMQAPSYGHSSSTIQSSLIPTIAYEEHILSAGEQGNRPVASAHQWRIPGLDGKHASQEQLHGVTYVGIHLVTSRIEVAKAIYLRAAFYRPPGNPVLVGSDTFGRVQSGIPTHRYGAEAPATATSTAMSNPLALLIWHTASSPCTLDEEPTRCMLLSSQGGACAKSNQ